MLESEKHSLDSLCCHEITFYRFNYKLPPAPSFEKKIWLYDQANPPQIRASISNFPRAFYFQSNSVINWQDNSYSEIILNIISTFIPSKIINVVPSNPSCMTKNLKTMLNRQKRLYRNCMATGMLN